MSCIEPTDIGGNYDYSSFVMSSRLGQVLEGKDTDFPVNVIREIEQVFDLALSSALPLLGNANKPRNLLKENAHYLLLADTMKELYNGEADYSATGRMNKFSGLVKNLQTHGYGIVNADKDSYRELQKFLEHLSVRSDQFSSGSILAGLRSPYSYV